MSIIHGTTMTPMGPFSWLQGTRGVLASGWTTEIDYLTRLAGLAPEVSVARDDTHGIEEAIDDFFAGNAEALDPVLVDQSGGPFITHVWQTLRAIPVGQTRTYAELAAAAGRPRAVRAAASACATNRAALFVPCHRVLRADRSLGGFRYGASIKAQLLDLEARLF